MKNRIKEYADYHFRFDGRDNIDEVKDEMISNLIDRYNDYVTEGKKEEEAYIETIKYLGEISQTEEDSFDTGGKMSWALIAMVTVTALSYSAALLSLFSSLIGLITTMISIVLFATAGYHLYVSSQFEKKEKYDLELQRVNMRIIMKYFRQNYFPWSFSLTISFTGVVMGLIFLMTSENLASIIMNDGIFAVIAVYGIVGFIVFVIIFKLLKLLEKKLYSNYTYITGERIPDLMSRNLFNGLGFSFDINGYLVFLIFSSIGINLTYATVHISSNFSVNGVYLSLIPDLPLLLIPIFITISAMILMVIKKNMKRTSMFFINLVNLAGYFLMAFYLEQFTRHYFSDISAASIVMLIVLLLIYFIPIVSKKINKKV